MMNIHYGLDHYTHRCGDCGKQHESWSASTLCCEPKRTNKRASVDSRCVICDRFTPKDFGCHGKFLADYTDAINKRAAKRSRSPEKQALMDAVKSDRLIAKLSRNEQKAMRTTFIEIL